MLHMLTLPNEQKPTRKVPYWAVSFCLSSLLFSCGSGEEHVSMERRGQTFIGRADWMGTSTTSAERFGSMQGSRSGSGQASQMSKPQFEYELPEGWVLDLPNENRLLNIKVAGRADSPCYLAVLPGTAGGVLSNVNRWRGQFGAEPITEADIQNLPTLKLFSVDAIRVDVTGHFAGAMGSPEIPEGSLVGLITQAGGNMIFLKMLGPKSVIDQEKEHFEAFVASLNFAGATAGGTNPPGASAERKLAHVAPESWTLQGPRQMRFLGYDLPGGVDLYITILGGQGGGIAANINRWRQQLGLSPLPDAELLAGERIECMGTSAYWVHLDGSYAGMGGVPSGTKDTMMGVILPMGAETLFVKCVGPTEAMQSSEADIRSFIASLKWETSQ